MNILLAGGTGFIGRNLTAALNAADHRIIQVSRRNGIDFAAMQTTANWLPYLENVDAVINCVGIIGENRSQQFVPLHSQAPIALFQACKQAGIHRVIQISALGADETAFSAYHLSKRTADEHLRALDLDWFVLRPSLIYGRAGKSAELFMRLAALPLIPVIGDGQQLLQPVHINDVVATVLECLVSTSTNQTLDIVGTETLTFVEWLQMMRHAQGLPRARLLRLPFRMMLALSYLGRYFNPILQPENLRMLQTGYWADFKPLIRFLGHPPLAIAPHLFFSDIKYTEDSL